MAKKDKDIKKEIQTAEAAPEAVEAVEAAAADTAQKAESAADSLKDTVVKVSDDDAKVQKVYTKKELKEIEKKQKELHKKYHVSNWETITTPKSSIIATYLADVWQRRYGPYSDSSFCSDSAS